MARETLVGLNQKIANLNARVEELQARDYMTCPLTNLSGALLDRIDTLKMSKREEIDEAEIESDNLDRAFCAADDIDDQVRDLEAGG